MLRKWGYLIAALAFGIFLAVLSTTPPAPRGADAAAIEFSSARAMEDIRIIAANPHPTGSEENAKIRAYLADRMTALGMDVSTSESLLPARALKRLNGWSGIEKSEQTIVNVIGLRAGSDRSKPAVLLMAHHDTVWDSPGAADDTIGVASILEIVRALNAQGVRDRDLIVLFTDGEEVGLSGATHFFETHPLRDDVGAVINFEARGGGGTINLFQTSAENGEAARLFARAVKEPGGSSLSTYIYNILPNDTDLTPALKRDYVAYNLANLGRAEYYHSPKISAEALSEATVQHMGSLGLDLTRALLRADALPAKSPDAIFFDVFGLFTVTYAAFWGWIFLIAGTVFYMLSAVTKIVPKEILGGIVRMSLFLGLGVGVLFGLNLLSGGGSGSNYYDRLAAIPKLEVMTLLTCAALFFAIFGRAKLSASGILGASLVILMLTIPGQAIAPTAVYFLTLTLLLGGTAALIHKHLSKAAFIPVILCALVLGYMLSLGHLLMLGVGPDLPSVAVLPAALAALTALQLYPGLSKRRANQAMFVCLALAIALALVIRLDPMALTVPTY